MARKMPGTLLLSCLGLLPGFMFNTSGFNGTLHIKDCFCIWFPGMSTVGKLWCQVAKEAFEGAATYYMCCYKLLLTLNAGFLSFPRCGKGHNVRSTLCEGLLNLSLTSKKESDIWL